MNKIRVFGPLCDARHGGDGGGGLLLLLRPPQVRSNHQDDDLYGGQGKTYFLFQRVEVLGSMLVTPRDNEFQKLSYIVSLKVGSSILYCTIEGPSLKYLFFWSCQRIKINQIYKILLPCWNLIDFYALAGSEKDTYLLLDLAVL